MDEKKMVELMEKLAKKIEDKSVAHTLNGILQGKKNNQFFQIKGMSSLLTHIAIECESGNTEYYPVLLEVNSRIQRLLATIKL